MKGRRASTRSTARGVQRATTGAASSDLIPAGVLNRVGDTIVTARAGVHDVGAAAVAAARGSIRAAYQIGGDLGLVAREAVRFPWSQLRR